ncbi:hypothetical protein J1605_000330 [Eschrichtius robustus]|uniref:40S ribosomal protein S15 n=1 Tax=Eschrichtius robustus TaxID=9764 RepID=A0AB34HR30_ESCRO|nr:hypothetical protein J1605_000330 [Eschrichtius robustus]
MTRTIHGLYRCRYEGQSYQQLGLLGCGAAGLRGCGAAGLRNQPAEEAYSPLKRLRKTETEHGRGVYNCKSFSQVEIKPEMMGPYLSEFSTTYRPVKYGGPGIRTTHFPCFFPLK